MSNERLAPQTAADTSVEVHIQGSDHVVISASGLGAAETIPIEIKQGAAWATFTEAGTIVAVTADDSTRVIAGNGMYRANKGVTVGTVGIYVNRINTIY